MTVLSRLDGIFTLPGRTKHSTEGFSRWKEICFRLTPNRRWQELSKTPQRICSQPRVSDADLESRLAPTGSLELLLPGSTGCKKSDPSARDAIDGIQLSPKFCFQRDFPSQMVSISSIKEK